MNYKQTLEMLYDMMPDFQSVGAAAYKPGLERVREFNDYLGSPDKHFHTIHVAGTNGKGSVSHMLAAILHEAGYKVGLYTSPHLFDFRERIRVNGQMIEESAVVEFAHTHREKMEELDLSFFEATVGMAFSWFSECGVDVAVIETGLGGRLDATNIITPLVSVITNIGVDHVSFLGATIESIAAEKAGIIKHNVPVVIGEMNPQAEPVFESTAKRVGAEILHAYSLYKCVEVAEADNGGRLYLISRAGRDEPMALKLDLMGDYQRHNIVTVLAAVEALNSSDSLKISIDAIERGVASTAASTGLAGRWQVIGEAPLTVCDTGHNAAGIEEVARQIERQKFDKLYVVIGVANDKDLSSILPLLPTDAHYIFTQAPVSRALPAQELEKQAAAYGLHGEVVVTVPAAVARARLLAQPQDMIFIGGSNFIIGAM